MCSNQYMTYCSEITQKICRVFFITDDEENQIRRFQINIAKFCRGRIFDLVQVFKYMEEKGLTLTGFKFYFPHLNIQLSPNQQCYNVSLDQFTEKKIRVIATYINLEKQEFEPQQNTEIPKKHKEGQRFIRYVLQSVKLWRWMHNKKMSLTEAAKVIKISKKSLDDYFLQLRLGELYGFEFKDNLDQKIGVLRAYIRKNENKEMQGNLPKAIRSFELVRDVEEIEKEMITDKGVENEELEQIEESKISINYQFNDFRLENL